MPVPRLGLRRDGQERGRAVEGPESGVCGKPGTEARVYPTRTLKGVVFVWMGERRARADRGGRARGVLRRRRARPDGPGLLEAATGRSRSRTRWTRTSTTCTATRSSWRARGSSRAAPRASTRSSSATGSAATSPRATTCARARPSTSTRRLAWPKTNYRRLWTWLLRPFAERARRTSRRRSRALVRRPPPARDVPRRVRVGPLHAHVRAGRGAPHARVVLPLPPPEERVARAWQTFLYPRCTGAGSSSTTSRARTSA